MRQQRAALANEVVAPPEQVAGLTHALGIDVGEGKVAAFEQASEFAGVDFVVLGLGAVDEFHVQGVTDDERDLLLGAEVGDPVPGEHALGGEDDVFAKGSEGAEE